MAAKIKISKGPKIIHITKEMMQAQKREAIEDIEISKDIKEVEEEHEVIIASEEIPEEKVSVIEKILCKEILIIPKDDTVKAFVEACVPSLFEERRLAHDLFLKVMKAKQNKLGKERPVKKKRKYTKRTKKKN